MLPTIALFTLLIALTARISSGQTENFRSGVPFAFGDSYSGISAPNFSQDFGSAAALSNPPPVESFINAMKAAVYSSQILPNIFDLDQLSGEAFSKSMYDYVYATTSDLRYKNPHNVASTISNALKGISAFTLPLMLDLYGNAIGGYLFSKGVLNPSNASTLALKYVKTMEDTAKRSWVKDIPQSKFLVLEHGFRDYMISLDQRNLNNVEDLVFHFARAVKGVGTRF